MLQLERLENAIIISLRKGLAARMETIIYILFPLVTLIIIFVLVRLILSNRYSFSAARKFLLGIFFLSFVISIIYYIISMTDFQENHTDYVNPAIDWQKVDSLNSSAESIEYIPEYGLIAVTELGEIRITKEVPYCSIENQSADIKPKRIEITDTPFAEIPAPPKAFSQQIIIEMRYSVEYDALGISSFAILENGEVWCSERVFRGPADFPMAALISFGILLSAIAVFVGSLVSILVLVIISLEISRLRKSRTSK